MGMQYSAVMVDQVGLDAMGPDPDADEICDLLDSGLQLDKMWNAAQVVLGGSMEAGEPLMTGREFGEDLGYGPAQLASVADVIRVASELDAESMEQLVARVDVKNLDALGTYPMIWLSEPAASLVDQVGRAAWQLANLYRDAASRGCLVLAAIY